MGDRAALIRGPSGAGKSDLALRCLALAPSALLSVPALLVSDDQVCLERVGDQITARAPEVIRGKLEVRGIGIIAVPAAATARVALVVDLVGSEDIERLPGASLATEILGLEVPLMRLAPFEASAPVKLLVRLCAPRAVRLATRD
jgi:serine kinase of HPr protein (carbohydrate metabolism regulator)